MKPHADLAAPLALLPTHADPSPHLNLYLHLATHLPTRPPAQRPTYPLARLCRSCAMRISS